MIIKNTENFAMESWKAAKNAIVVLLHILRFFPCDSSQLVKKNMRNFYTSKKK